MTVGFLSLPPELIYHILLLLNPRDLARCISICKKICDAVQDSIDIQYKLELYAQGFVETTALDSTSISRKMRSLKELTSLWRSDFHAKLAFEEAVEGVHGGGYSSGVQSVTFGLWSTWTQNLGHGGNLFIRDCNANVQPSRAWPTHSFSRLPISVIVDPLQDLVVVLSAGASQSGITVTEIMQDYQIFLAEFWLASSQLPYPHSACTSLQCRHTFDAPGRYNVHTLGHAATCGDLIVFLYYVRSRHVRGPICMQVINWRRGYVKSYPLREVGGKANIYLVDKQTIVIGGNNHLILYTLREDDGSPQHRITYLLPGLRYPHASLFYIFHTPPPFHYDREARTGLMPDYMPSRGSQIIVLEILSPSWPVILVIDTIIFSEQVIHSETPVTVPWSDWGPKYTCCFPHHPSHRISVFGSKMAYTLPWDHTPKPGERPERLSNDTGHFYVHIWDFNKRSISRAESIHDCNSSDPLVRKPGRLDKSPFIEPMVSNHPYTATVCRTPFVMDRFVTLFLGQDRLILTWSHPNTHSIQVFCPIVDTNFTM